MRYPQIVVHERDGRLADQLRPLAAAERWGLREPRQADVLWRTLESGGPTVFVIRLGRPPDQDFELIERISWLLPDVATVVVGDPDDAPPAAGLAWDLGAAYALFPPQSRDLLPDIVAGLVRRSVRDSLPSTTTIAEPLP
jgi:hypothetical protein